MRRRPAGHENFFAESAARSRGMGPGMGVPPSMDSANGRDGPLRSAGGVPHQDNQPDPHDDEYPPDAHAGFARGRFGGAARRRDDEDDAKTEKQERDQRCDAEAHGSVPLTFSG